MNICFASIKKLNTLLRKKKISVYELTNEFLKNIKKNNSKVNALIYINEKNALRKSKFIDNLIAKKKIEFDGLVGIPVANKDTFETKSMPTTFGSKIFENYKPTFNASTVQSMENALCVSLGKTNVPEFAAGSQSYNELFGATKNPYDLSKTSGGSTGGGAAGLASGFYSITDGSDFGGSLRNPASFCNVVGLRPSPGLIPVWPNKIYWFPLNVNGFMARTITDLSIALNNLQNKNKMDPMSMIQKKLDFNLLNKNKNKYKVGVFNLEKFMPIDNEVSKNFNTVKKTLRGLGHKLFSINKFNINELDEVFIKLRAYYFYISFSGFTKKQKNMLKPSIKWNINLGSKLTVKDLSNVEIKRNKILSHLYEEIQKYDFMISPVSQVLPFSYKQEFPTSINNKKMNSYLDWMKSCYLFSATSLPCLSIPSGFSKNGLPIGTQFIGKIGYDDQLLNFGREYEKETNFTKIKPNF